MRIAITILATMFVAQTASAGTVGNGGGVICITPDKCITLAEAGLKLKHQPEGFYRLPQALLDHAKLIISISGIHPEIQRTLFQRVLGKTKTYQPVETIDEKKHAQLKAAYLKTVKDIDANFRLNNFEIVAWSDSENKVTYLLPRFFELTMRRQAYLLIHEANVRESRDSQVLMAALQFDVLFQSLVEKPGTITDPNFDWVTFFKALNILNLTTKDVNLESMILKSIFAKNQMSSLPLSKICQSYGVDSRREGNYKYSFFSCMTEYEMLLKLADIDPRLVMYLEGKNVFAGVGLRYYFEKTTNKLIGQSWSNYWGDASEKVNVYVRNDQGEIYQRYLGVCNAVNDVDLIEGHDSDPVHKAPYHLVVDDSLPSIQSKVFLLRCDNEKDQSGNRKPFWLDEIKLR